MDRPQPDDLDRGPMNAAAAEMLEMVSGHKTGDVNDDSEGRIFDAAGRDITQPRADRDTDLEEGDIDASAGS